MKILLIYPPITAYISDTPSPTPPLGLAYIAAVLEENNYDVKIIDALTEGLDNCEKKGEFIRVGLDDESIKRRILEFEPDIVGISASYTASSKDSHNVARLVKEINPDIPVVFGGAHSSALPEVVLNDKNVDIVVIGEGEITFLELVKNLETGKDTDKIPGTVVRKEDKICYNPPRPYIEDLDRLPFPARHLLPMDIYLHKIPPFLNDYSMRQPRTTMITSRGCVYNCVYCSIHSVWGHKWRPRSAINVVDEIEYLVDTYKVREIAFLDDNLTLDKKRMNDICEEILRRKIDISWSTPNGIAIWKLDKELIIKMKKSGCWKLTFGIESASYDTQKFIGKHVNLDKANQIIKYANDAGMWTHAFFIIGFPYELLDSITETINYAIKSDLDFANFFIATPYPRTKLFDIFKKENLLQDGLSYQSLNKPAWNTKFFTKEELIELQNKAYSEFINSRIKRYLNPVKLFKKINSFEDLKFIIKMAQTSTRVKLNLKKYGRIQTHAS